MHTSQSQIWLSCTRTLSKTRTRINPAYAFVLALRKRVNPEVEITWHLSLYIDETHSQLARWNNALRIPYTIPLILEPPVGSNLFLSGCHKLADGVEDEELDLSAAEERAPCLLDQPRAEEVLSMHIMYRHLLTTKYQYKRCPIACRPYTILFFSRRPISLSYCTMAACHSIQHVRASSAQRKKMISTLASRRDSRVLN
jgi:hypothetical protein